MTHWYMRPNVILPAKFCIASSLPRYNTPWSRLELWMLCFSPLPLILIENLNGDSNERQARSVRGMYQKLEKVWTGRSDISAKMLHTGGKGKRGVVMLPRPQCLNIHRYLSLLVTSQRRRYTEHCSEQQSAVTPSPSCKLRDDSEIIPFLYITQ